MRDHLLFVPHLPPAAIAPEPEIERLDKLRRYHLHHRVLARYGLTFREFEAKVSAGTWEAYRA